MAETTGDRIRMQRKNQGLSSEDVAAKIGKSIPTLYRYEQSNYDKIPLSIIDVLAPILNTSVCYLMTYTSDPRPIDTDQPAAEYYRYIKIGEKVHSTFYETRAKEWSHQFRLEKKITKHLSLLTEEDMHSIFDYISFLASRHKDAPTNSLKQLISSQRQSPKPME